MAREFKEVANLRTDRKKYDTNYDNIFKKNKEVEEEVHKVCATCEAEKADMCICETE